MSGSPFFARIRADVVAILHSVPEGAAVSYADIGAWLDVAPRHVAYIVKTQLTPADAVDPTRVVPAGSDHPGLTRVASLAHGIPPQTRPADAPVPRAAKRRR